MKYLQKKLILGFIACLAICVFCESSFATQFFYYDAEDNAIGDEIPHHQISGPEYCQTCWGDPDRAIVRDAGGAPQGNHYYEWVTDANQTNASADIVNKGVFPVSVTMGDTYYLAAFVRFDRIGGIDIWHEGTSTQSGDKYLEIYGSRVIFRWMLGFGQWGHLAANQDHHFTTWLGGVADLNPGIELYGAYKQNRSGYDENNPIQLDYERWYAMVMKVTVACDNTGSIALWVNGVLILEHNNIQTSVDCTGIAITKIQAGGTIAQPAYDAPAHYRKQDALMLTDNWQDIVDGGYLSVGGEDTTAPTASGHNPSKSATGIAPNTNIVVHVLDSGDGVDIDSLQLTVNSEQIPSGSLEITGSASDYTLTYDPPTDFDYNSVITVSIDAQDLHTPEANVMGTDTWSFTTKGLLDVEYFTRTPGDRQVALSWTIPDDEDYAGVEIRCFASSDTNYDEYPATHEQGELVCRADTPGNNCLHTEYNGQPLVNGYRYNYSAFSYDLYGNYSTTAHTYAIPTSSGTYNTKVFGDATDSDHIGTLEDTFININEENSSTHVYLNTYTWPQDTVANAIIMNWDLSAIPSSAVIQDATLHLYLSGTGGDDLYDLTVHKIIHYNPVISACTGYTYNGTNSWTPNSQCYNNIPLAQADIASAEDTKSINKTYGYKSWNVTNMVQDWVSNQGSNYGMLVNSDPVASSGSNRFFSATESSNPDQRPKLVVTYTVGNVPPTASASANPTSGTAPLAVTFTGSGSDSDGTIVSYSWKFGDGGTSTSQNPAHTYSSEGNYTATLTVTDDDDATGSDTVAISVASGLDTIAPTVTITHPTSADTYITDQDTITLSGTGLDKVGVTSVTWTNSRGGNGTASGTTDWTISAIPLYCGDDNIITIIAKDAANNTASATLTIDVNPCPVKGLGL